MKITETQAKAILAELTAAMEAVSVKHNLKRGKVRLVYGIDDIKITGEFGVVGGRSKQEITYERHQRLLRLPPSGHPVQGCIEHV